MRYLIGIDIGGTKIHSILVQDGRIIERVHVLHAKKTREAVLEVILRTIETLGRFTKGRKISGIGVAVPSALDPGKSVLLSSPNFASLKRLRLGAWLEKKLHIPVMIENDARCFTMGADIPGFSSRRGHRSLSVLGLTIGTGLGGGIRLGTDLWEGSHGASGEIGHTVIAPKGERCVCGQRGCLEMYVSRKFLRRMDARDPKTLEQLAFKGNKKARRIYEELGYYLGIGIANAVNTIDPDVVVLGGGIAKAHELFLRVTRIVASAHIISPGAKHLPIVAAKNIDDAGAVGATMLFAGKTTQNTNYTKHKL